MVLLGRRRDACKTIFPTPGRSQFSVLLFSLGTAASEGSTIRGWNSPIEIWRVTYFVAFNSTAYEYNHYQDHRKKPSVTCNIIFHH